MSKYGVFSGPYFPLFVLNPEIYGVNLRIQSEYRKIRTGKNSVFEHFSPEFRMLNLDYLNFIGLNIPMICEREHYRLGIQVCITNFLLLKTIYVAYLVPLRSRCSENWDLINNHKYCAVIIVIIINYYKK